LHRRKKFAPGRIEHDGLTGLLDLTIAIADYPHTRCDPVRAASPSKAWRRWFANVVPQDRRLSPDVVRDVEFDVCELAPTTYIIARAHGAPFVALPIILSRAFHHGGLLVRPDAGIKTPKDLEGKKVGVRAYSVTTGVWTRGILIDDYGLDSSKVTWVVDDEELRPRAETAAQRDPCAGRQVVGRNDGEWRDFGGFLGQCGLGRAGAPTAGWEAKSLPHYPELFAETLRRWRRPGTSGPAIYPCHHGTIVVKDSVLKQHPWVARSLHQAFAAAKAEWLAALCAGEAGTASDEKYRRLIPLVGPIRCRSGSAATCRRFRRWKAMPTSSN